jgi:hypothetical protein
MKRKWLLASIIGGLAGLAIWHRRKKRRTAADCWSVNNSLDDVVQAHAEYLHSEHPAYYDKFMLLVKADLEAAMGEATVFSLLRTYFRAGPQPADEPGRGGVDFVCKKGTPDEFVVEVTSLKPEAVAAQSDIPVSIDDSEWGAFRMTTNQLFSTVKEKADQLADYPCPRVLAITSTHHASGHLLGPTGAEFLLTSEPTIRYPVAGSGAQVTITTNLRRSVFFGPGESGTQIVSRRRSVSGVLLVALSDTQSALVGLLHPDPVEKLKSELFHDVPFLRLANWPVVDGAINTEWIVSSPDSKIFYHAPIWFRQSAQRQQ